MDKTVNSLEFEKVPSECLKVFPQRWQVMIQTYVKKVWTIM